MGKWTVERSCQETVSHLPVQRAVFPFFCMERNVAGSRHPPVLGGNLSDFALPGRGSVGEGAGPVPVVKRSLHSRPIKAGKKPYQNPQILAKNRSSSSTLSQAVWYFLPRRAMPGTGGGSEGDGNQHRGLPALAARTRKRHREKINSHHCVACPLTPSP